MPATILNVLPALLLAGCVGYTPVGNLLPSAPFTPAREHFADTTWMEETPLESQAGFSTVNGYQPRAGPFKATPSDSFLRGSVDKATGKTIYQVHQVIAYHAYSSRTFDTVIMPDPSGWQLRQVRMLGRDVDCYGSQISGCTFIDHLVFELDDGQLRQIASLYSAGAPDPWPLRFTARSGEEYVGAIYPAEAAGLLDRVEGYRAALGRTGTVE